MKKVSLLIVLVVWICTLHAQVMVKIGNVSGAEPGSLITVPVLVSGMNAGTGGISVSAIQLSVSYDNAYLTYDSTINFNDFLPGSQWFYGSTGSKYSTNWIEPNLLSIDIPDNTILFEMRFLYTGGTTQLDFIASSCEILNSSYDIIQNVQYQGGQVTPSQGSFVSVWTGAGDWNTPSNWSNGIPGEQTLARIQSGNISIISNATCMLLEIVAGAELHVYPGSTLTIDSLTTNAGSFFIHSDPSGTGSVIFRGEVTGNGLLTIENYLDAGSDQFHLIASPVSGYSAGSQPEFTFGTYSEVSSNWSPLSSGTILSMGSGYQVNSTGSNTVNFSGKPRFQSLALNDLSFSGTVPKYKGLNLIGNPFTSALKWGEGGWDRAQIDGAVYIWNGYKYLCWNGSVGSLSDGLIPAMQGFFVRAVAPVNSLSLPEDARIHSSIQLFKESGQIEKMVRMKIEKTDDADHFDEAFLQLSEGSTEEFDGESDAYKYFGTGTYPEIYTTTSDGSELAINVKEGVESVPVVCKVSTPGTYKVTFDNLNSFPSDQQLSFEDKVEGTSINLRTTDNLIFISNGTTEPSRFMFHFYLVGVGEKPKMPFRMWNDEEFLYFGDYDGDLHILAIDILNVSGVNLLHADKVSMPGSLSISRLNPGLYIATIKTDRGYFAGKLLVPAKN